MEQNGPMTMGDLRRFRTELMYPYDLSDFTEITSSKSFHDQPLQFQMPFFGFRYTYVWVFLIDWKKNKNLDHKQSLFSPLENNRYKKMAI